MNGGILIALGGVWLGCQVFGGQALERLGLIEGGPAPASKVPNNPVDKTTALVAGGIPLSGLSIAEQLAPDLPPVSGLGLLEELHRRGVTGSAADAAGGTVHLGKKLADVLGGWVP